MNEFQSARQKHLEEMDRRYRKLRSIFESAGWTGESYKKLTDLWGNLEEQTGVLQRLAIAEEESKK